MKRFLCLTLAFLFAAGPTPLRAAEPPRVLAGKITNTTHGVTAPARFELVFEGDKITGFLVVDPPLLAGRWPVEGKRRGAWCEFMCRQTEATRVVFQGVLSEAGIRGTYLIGGGPMIEYGRFQATVVPAPQRVAPGT